MKTSTTNKSQLRQPKRRLLCILLAVAPLVIPVQLTAAEPTKQPIATPTTTGKAAPTRLPTVRRGKTNRVQQEVKPVSALTDFPKPAARPNVNSTTKPDTERLPTDWLPSGTAASKTQIAIKKIGQADQEFRVGAWLSAETSAWEALRWAAEAIDHDSRRYGRLPSGDTTALATSNLQVAKQAIIEARDFAKTAESQTPESIARIARSHQTDVLRSNPAACLSATDASDLYLDFARTRLAIIASHSVQAAHAMDLLAAIYLRRSESRTLPSATALCLRRAAIQGQPENASLAANLGVQLTQVGLHREAQWALEHSLSIDPNPLAADALATLHRKSGRHDLASSVIAAVPKTKATTTDNRAIRVPEITELSADEFAALSQSVVWTDDSSVSSRQPDVVQQSPVILASTRIQTNQPVQHQSDPTTSAGSKSEATEFDAKKTGPVGWLKNSWKRITN